MKLVALALGAFLAATAGGTSTRAESGEIAPPRNVEAYDHPFDGGDRIDLRWEPSPDDPLRVTMYRVYRSLTPGEAEAERADRRARMLRAAKDEATERARTAAEVEGLDPRTVAERIRAARLEAAARAAALADSLSRAEAGTTPFQFVSIADPGARGVAVTNLSRHASYLFRVEAVDREGGTSSAVTTMRAINPQLQWFDGGRFYLLIVTVIFCGSVVYWIEHARRGRKLNVRKIAGLEAVDEAVGRATEMGRSCLYVPGIQDMNEMQTIASMTILARVSRTAARYQARVEVPTSKSLVMTTARETVAAAFLAAGRPDAYNEDLVYYVTDEQFGYVAYLSGLMVRERPAACFYMGAFFAESLILAEMGNSIGAIQVAGTAQPAQLPFFVAACDYTLIGEEFFAASAYLSGSPEELGSLKGQDVGKVIVGAIVAASVALATVAAITGSTALADVVEYIRQSILT
jgi:hypothetical protein